MTAFAFNLKIPQRIPPGIQNIPFDIHPESNEKVDDHRRTQRHEGHIDEVFTDGGRGNTHPLAYGRTHAEYVPLDKVFEPVHPAKLKTFFPKTKALKNGHVSVNLRHLNLGIWRFGNVMMKSCNISP